MMLFVVTRRQAVLVVGMVMTVAALMWSSYRAATPVMAPPGHRAPVTLPAPDAQQKEQRDGDGDNRGMAGIVQLKFLGRLGNNLFEYATARVVADRLGWALSLQPAPGNAKKFGTLLRPQGMKCFPGVRPLGPPRSSPEMAQLEAAPFRSFKRELSDPTPRAIVMMDWYQEYKPLAGDSDRLREVREGEPVLRVLLLLLLF